jgi:hypothetical protein
MGAANAKMVDFLRFSVGAIEPERLARQRPAMTRVLRFVTSRAPVLLPETGLKFDRGLNLMHAECSMTTTATPVRSSQIRLVAACGLIFVVVISILPL